jgi:cysteinyl-tRNA synthetase
MSLRVYNTLTRQKETFTPVRPGKVGMYLCGPTVYKSPHIGHMVGPIIFDALKRYLKYKGFEVTWVVNITDVDDKLIDAAHRLSSTVHDVAEKYTREYMDVLGQLGIDGIDHFPKASEHMPEIVDIIQRLVDRGAAYPAGGGVWFDVTKDDDYGKLSGRKLEEQASGTRELEGEGKRNPADFALWKAAKPGEPAWESPWGPGRPGWHIECSAMSMKYLGETFDMHGGGLDLMFPHHENELAQSECATGKPFAKYWLHNGLTRMKTKSASGEWKVDKIAGSEIAAGRQEGATVDARKLLADNGPELLRYLILSTHYRRPIEFTEDVVTAAKKGLSTFSRLFERVERLGGDVWANGPDMDERAPELLKSDEDEIFVRAVLNLKAKFIDTMDDDFNTAGAISVLYELAGEVNAQIDRTGAERTKSPEVVGAVTAAVQTIRRLGKLLGLFVKPAAAESAGGDELVEGLMQLFIKLRQEARASKNFALADGIRKGLAEVGVTLEDRPDGTLWRRG